MPYVQESREYLSQQTKCGSPNHNRYTRFEFWREGISIPPWTYSQPYGTETTYSFRNRGQDIAAEKVMTGEDMRRAILHGEELVIDHRAPGGIYRSGEEIRRDGVLSSQFDQGHEFWSDKQWLHYTTFVDIQNGGWRYKGPIGVSTSNYSSLEYSSNPDISFKSASVLGRLRGLGNRAIAESAPTAPEAGLAVMISELRQLPSLPALTLLRHRSIRSTGGEYLNVQFGIKPLIKDVQTLARSVLKSREILEQYRRDAGLVVRRKRTLVDRVETTNVRPQGFYIQVPQVAHYNGYNYGTSQWFRTEEIMGITHEQQVESVWFSGAFSYYLQETDTLLGKLSAYEQMANKLLGGRLDADTFWELTPWSWLIDWFLDVSSFIGRINRLASDNLVLRYGYVMHEVHLERTAMLPNVLTRSGQVVPTPQVTYHSHRMNRVRSTPYGFGVDLGALTPSRWAILAALGLTKAPGSLRTP